MLELAGLDMDIAELPWRQSQEDTSKKGTPYLLPQEWKRATSMEPECVHGGSLRRHRIYPITAI